MGLIVVVPPTVRTCTDSSTAYRNQALLEQRRVARGKGVDDVAVDGPDLVPLHERICL